MGKGSTGESKTWNKEKEDCVQRVFAFEGTPVPNEQAIKDALDAKYGRACQNWRTSKRDDKNHISKNGIGETKKPECGNGEFWFHSGKEFTNKADWTEFDNVVKKQTCEANMKSHVRINLANKLTDHTRSHHHVEMLYIYVINKISYRGRF